MEIRYIGDHAEWKTLFSRARVPVGPDDVCMHGPGDKRVYVVGRTEYGMHVECYTLKGEEDDRRNYQYYFEDAFVEDGYVNIKFYSYREEAWCIGRFVGSAGITGIRKIK